MLIKESQIKFPSLPRSKNNQEKQRHLPGYPVLLLRDPLLPSAWRILVGHSLGDPGQDLIDPPEGHLERG